MSAQRGEATPAGTRGDGRKRLQPRDTGPGPPAPPSPCPGQDAASPPGAARGRRGHSRAGHPDRPGHLWVPPAPSPARPSPGSAAGAGAGLGCSPSPDQPPAVPRSPGGGAAPSPAAAGPGGAGRDGTGRPVPSAARRVQRRAGLSPGTTGPSRHRRNRPPGAGTPRPSRIPGAPRTLPSRCCRSVWLGPPPAARPGTVGAWAPFPVSGPRSRCPFPVSAPGARSLCRSRPQLTSWSRPGGCSRPPWPPAAPAGAAPAPGPPSLARRPAAPWLLRPPRPRPAAHGRNRAAPGGAGAAAPAGRGGERETLPGPLPGSNRAGRHRDGPGPALGRECRSQDPAGTRVRGQGPTLGRGCYAGSYWDVGAGRRAPHGPGCCAQDPTVECECCAGSRAGMRMQVLGSHDGTWVLSCGTQHQDVGATPGYGCSRGPQSAQRPTPRWGSRSRGPTGTWVLCRS